MAPPALVTSFKNIAQILQSDTGPLNNVFQDFLTAFVTLSSFYKAFIDFLRDL